MPLRKTACRAVAVAAITWATQAGVAAAPPERASALVNYVNDYAHVLTPAELRELEQHLVDVSREGRYQIAIALYPQAPADASAVESTMLADRLMVGSSLEDRGIVILGFVAERVVRLEIGYGLEGLLPDVEAHRAAEIAAAAFARGRYAEGLRGALAYLEPRADSAVAQRPAREGRACVDARLAADDPRCDARVSLLRDAIVTSFRSSSRSGGARRIPRASRS